VVSILKFARPVLTSIIFNKMEKFVVKSEEEKNIGLLKGNEINIQIFIMLISIRRKIKT
jgi:hypothetical protein